MRIAIIDLGTNSVRFDIHQLGPGKNVRTLHQEKLMIRLGQRVFLEGKLDKAAVRRTLQAFSGFQRTASRLHVDKIVAFGTSALREASDSHKLLDSIRRRTGIKLRVITGIDEARLIAHGILSHEKNHKNQFGMVDIGGGSTEISICQGKKVESCDSFPLGTARLQQVFLKTSPPHPDAIKQLRKHIRGILQAKLATEDWSSVEYMIGSSGTIKCLARILERHEEADCIEAASLKKLIKNMSTMTTSQLLGIPGIEERRVDMLLSGAILLEECMRAFKAHKTIITDYSLRDGILEEEIKFYRSDKNTAASFKISDVIAKAKRFGADEAHIKGSLALADILFDKLQKTLKIKPQWKIYLLAATALRHTGEAVSLSHHEAHSHYIVQNTDLPSLQVWEAEFIAELCLYHSNGKINLDHLPFVDEPLKISAFFKLLALLRIVDALDASPTARVQIRRCLQKKKLISLYIAGRNLTDLEGLRVAQKKKLFEELTGKSLVVQYSQNS